MDKPFIRIAYAVEYFVALIAVLTLWAQAGGQGHLDLVYWYWKLGLALVVPYACVKATQAAISHERPWNARTLRWLSVVVVLMAGAALLTYYGHLYYEDQDTGEEDQQEEPALTIHGAGGGVLTAQANSASARSISARMYPRL